jgi:hypothetical protein
MLENTSCSTEIEEDKVILKKDLDFICRVVPTCTWTIQDYTVAYFQNRSRAYMCEINGVKKEVLAPIFDMLNHSKTPNSTFKYCDQRKGFCLIATADIDEGLEVATSYGTKQ